MSFFRKNILAENQVWMDLLFKFHIFCNITTTESLDQIFMSSACVVQQELVHLLILIIPKPHN